MYELRQLPDRLALVHITNAKIKPISVDFCTKEYLYRCKSFNLAKEAIVKAIGWKNNKPALSVIDATAGFGRDAFILGSLGCKVQLIERSPIIMALLKDGIKRASNCVDTIEIIKNMQLIEGNAIQVLNELARDQYPDVICLDPMFPKRQKTALVKKEMLALRNIVGGDLDCNELLVIALKIAKTRVVVKRPRLAPPITKDFAPSFVLEGSANRFDVYLSTQHNLL